jgi:hypothetical protein
MIICICNNISTSAVTRDPSLLQECGTQCGTCALWLESPEGQQFTQQLKFETYDAAN